MICVSAPLGCSSPRPCPRPAASALAIVPRLGLLPALCPDRVIEGAKHRGSTSCSIRPSVHRRMDHRVQPRWCHGQQASATSRPMPRGDSQGTPTGRDGPAAVGALLVQARASSAAPPPATLAPGAGGPAPAPATPGPARAPATRAPAGALHRRGRSGLARLSYPRLA